MLKYYIPGRDATDTMAKVGEDFPGIEFRIDDALAFYREITPEIESGKELLSVRFSFGKIRIPGGIDGIVGWHETDPDDKAYNVRLGTIRVPWFAIGHVKDFPARLARLDLYGSKHEMILDIESIYDCKLKPDDILSGYLLGELKRKQI
jgi:hypothetical protein